MSKRLLIPSDEELTRLYPNASWPDRVNQWIGDNLHCQECGEKTHYAGNGLACCPKCFTEQEF